MASVSHLSCFSPCRRASIALMCTSSAFTPLIWVTHNFWLVGLCIVLFFFFLNYTPKYTLLILYQYWTVFSTSCFSSPTMPDPGLKKILIYCLTFVGGSKVSGEGRRILLTWKIIVWSLLLHTRWSSNLIHVRFWLNRIEEKAQSLFRHYRE